MMTVPEPFRNAALGVPVRRHPHERPNSQYRVRMATFYDILGVLPDATPDDIRRAFRSEAKRLHPDTESGNESQMLQLNEAYETLRDAARRASYDQSLQPRGYRLPKRPAPAGPVAMDPIDYRERVFHPLDLRITRALQALDQAIVELAYDIYDDIYIARFSEAVQATEVALALAYRQLMGTVWPSPLVSALNLYRQGIRQADDAIEDFGGFLVNLDSDLLIEGRSLLRWALEMMAEARESLGIA